MKVHVRNKEGSLVPLEVLTLKGEKGEQGIQGIKGDKGEDGVTPNITIGTVTTLEAGEKATVTREGTKENPVFNFGIPKGADGASSSDDGASIDDSTISTNKTWSSSKIEDFVLTNDNTIWKDVNGENSSIEHTKKGYLREVEILGNTVRGFADCVTSKQIVDSILSTGLDNKTQLNSDGTFTVDRHVLPTIDWNTVSKEGFIQLEPNTQYSVGCWRDNDTFPLFYYTLYEETRTVGATGSGITFTTGTSGKVLLYPKSAQDGKLKVRVVKGDYKLTDYPYDFNLSVIQHLGELYVDDDGKPKLDSQGRNQYEIEVETTNANYNLFNLSNVAYGKDIDSTGNLVNKSSDSICLDYIPVVEGDKIFISGGNWKKIIAYDENKNYIRRIYDSPSGSGSCVIPKGVSFIRLGCGQHSLEAIKANKTMFVFGDKQLEYKESYISYDNRIKNKITILIPCQLMKVGNISDRLYWDKDKGRYVIEKNIKTTNLPVIENVTNSRIEGVNGGRCSFDCYNKKFKEWQKAFLGIPKLESFNGTDGTYMLIPDSISILHYSNHWLNGSIKKGKLFSISHNSPNAENEYISLLFRNTNCTDVEEMNNWVMSFSGKVAYYRLVTPELIETNITEELKLPTYINNTYISVNGGIDGGIKAKAPIDGEKVIKTLQRENAEIKATNDKQDELINTTMLATDEMFMMLEPLLAEAVNLNERSVSKMVDMYVAMVQRGIKTIDQVPARYREQVKEILDKLEK